MTKKAAINLFLIMTSLLALNSAAMNISLPKPADIGPEWQGGTGVVIDDLNNPPAFFAQSMADVIEQFKSIGVKSMANLAYRKKANVMHQVELKYFEFSSIVEAVAWKKKKYGYDNWQQHYTKTQQDGLSIFDSLEMKKRIVFYQNYWITASTISDTDDHLVFLAAVIERIKRSR